MIYEAAADSRSAPTVTPRRILLLKPCCLGDVVQMTAVVAALQARWSEAAITVGVGRWSRPAVLHHPAVAEIVDLGQLGLRGKQRPSDLLRLWPTLRRRRFDLAIVPDRSPVLSLLTWLCGARIRAGYDSGGRGRWYTIRVQPLPGLHELDQALRLLTTFGIESLPWPTYFPGRQGAAEASEIRSVMPAGRPLALIAAGGGMNPGTHMPEKRWSTAGFAHVATALQAVGATVALVGAPSDRAASDAVLRVVPDLQDLTGRTTLASLGALASRSSVFIGNDSGVTHLAAATGCPTVAIFGPTASQLYAPRGPYVQVVAPDAAARMGGEGSVRDPFRYAGPWQEQVRGSTVSSAALAALRPCPPEGP